MKDLFYSKSVWMVDDNVDGYNILPVVVEDTNYLMKRERNFRKYNQTLRLQLANDYDTINELSSEFPIPSPAPCEFYNVFVTNGGNAALVLQPTVDNTCIINVNAATRDRYINIIVRDSLDNTPVGGQTYYIEMNYNFTCTPPIKRLGFLALGNTSTGGGTVISLEGLQNPGTPIITNAVWGTPITEWNSMYLKLPAFIGTVTGQITIKVGFGNCP
jgi:hypothetical protein